MWKMVVCDICGSEIASSGIKLHKIWHTTEKPCGFCGKPVYGRKKFCNNICSAKFNKNRKGTGEYHTCICGKPVRRKYCSLECQNQSKYENYITEWLKGRISGGYGEGTGVVSSYIRRWLIERAGGKCEALLDGKRRCGWARKNPKTGKVPLTVHHKDGNSDNHRPENLELICPCCHSLTPTYGSGNRGNGRKGRKN